MSTHMLGCTPKTPIIDDSNYHYYQRLISDPKEPFTGGLDADRIETGFGTPFSRKEIPQNEWDDHIDRQEEEKSSPDHWRLLGDVPVLDQNGYGYCWCYGTVGAIMTTYAMSGGDAPKLSAMGPAAQGKNWANRGGYGMEALRYIDKFGIPELSVWPEHSNDRSLPKQESVKRSAAMHGVTEYEELPQNNWNALVSCLLDPERPRPVTIALPWWGHLVYATRVVRTAPKTYGIKFVNSWKISWGERGCGVLARSKAIAFEQIAIVRVKPRVAV